MRMTCLTILASATIFGAFPLLQTRAEVQRFPQFDNERATAWKSVIPAHSQSTMHRHDHFRTVVALTGGALKTVTADGQTTVTALEKGKAYWFAPMPQGVTHKDVNDTDQTIEVVVVEVK